LDDEWTLGATLNFPLFTGFLTKYQIEEAKANLETAQANEALVRQNVRFDVEQAFYELKNAREKINLAALTVKQAKENRELALGRYASEVGSPIEVADAVAAEVSAKTSYSAALFDYRLAIASLQKAMGENR
ncbi:MAG TPA: TolC family protein, partial [Deltaproteobacteria bacterium]|nr:TolC family protein [Deltaproteobacteria bacterium]